MEVARDMFESLSVSGSLSLIEQLPSELIYSILDFIPESLPNVRLTSKTLKSRADEHINTTRATVQNLSWGRVKNDIHVVFNVLQIHFTLFHLIFRLCKKPRPDKLKNLRTENLTFTNGKVQYYLIVDTTTDECTDVLEYLNTLIGRIECASCNDAVLLDQERALLRGVRIHTLNINPEKLSDGNMNRLMQMIEEHKIAELTLYADSVSCSDPVNALLYLSSSLKVLHVVQWGRNVAPGINHFFGRQDVDWAPIFLDMLSRRIDKLIITNGAYPGFLSLGSAEALIKGIPLLSKPVWFETTCTAYQQNIRYEDKGYVVQARVSGSSGESGFLKVIHSSRCPPDDTLPGLRLLLAQ